MPDSESTLEMPVSGARTATRYSALQVFVTAVIVLALMVLAIWLRLYRLSEVPPGLYSDEGAHGVDALMVLQGEHAVFFPPRSPLGSDGREGMVIYAIVPFVTAFGRTMLALRLPTALASCATIISVFWLGQVVFGQDSSGHPTRWRGLVVGGIGSGLMAVSIGQTIIGRMAFRANYLPLLLSLSLALLWVAWRQRNPVKIALAGTLGGLLQYTYIGARVTPLLFVVLGVSFWTARDGSEDSEKADGGQSLLREFRSSGELQLVAIFAAALVLVAAPIVFHFALHPRDLTTRIDQLWLLRDGPQDFIVAFLVNVWDHLLAFGFRGDPAWRRNFAGQPMLNLWEAAFFWLGVGISLRRWKECPACRLLLLWLGVMMLPAVLARDEAPHTIRMIGAAPAIYLLVSLGMWEVFQFLNGRLSGLKLFERSTINLFGLRNGATAGILMGIVILATGVSTYRTYFLEWANAHELNLEYEVEWSDLTKYLNMEPPDREAAFLIPDGQRQQPLKAGFRSHTFDYLYQGETPAYLFHSAMPDFAKRIQSTLLAVDDLSTVNVVEWNLKSVWTGDEYERFAFLLGKYGHYRDSEDLGSFRVHRYTDVSLSIPWKPYEFLEPLPVVYDGGIELLAVALGRGQDQLSIEEPILFRKSRNIWTVLQWHTADDLRIEYSVSLRLRNAEMTEVYTKDLILWKTDHTVTGDGGPAEQFDTWIHLDIPADIPPGEYELRLVVYDSKTLKPTVEMGVWEPERTLAILRVVAGH
ncbi:MAG: hypothetical protein OXF62_07155 [Caldilineaceae bacterium]|nr:hypothetical protein [Caldilineaceae bacterium]